MLFCGAAALIACGVYADVELPTREGVGIMVAQDLQATVRPGDPSRGVPFWNQSAMYFQYAPSFPFEEVKGAEKYVFRILDEQFGVHTFTATSPWAPLLPVWHELPTGATAVFCEGVDATGRDCGFAGSRTFWKTAPFTGDYPKPKRPYAEAAKKIFDYLLSISYVTYLADHGEPDPNYCLNSYPSKMHGANLLAMLEMARFFPDRRERAMQIARAEADYLLTVMQPADAALAHFPLTYDASRVIPGGRDGWMAKDYDGQSMNVYPAHVGAELVAFYEVTKETKYLDAAKKIADTFIRQQLPCGTWYLKQYLKDAKPVCPNLLIPGDVMQLLLDLNRITGERKYLDCADRALKWIDENPLKTWNWEGQFEDVRPTPAYVNLTKHSACNVALFLLQRFPDDPKRVAEAREILRFSEDQFVFWEKPGRPGVFDDTLAGYQHQSFHYPAVYEQYHCYVPIDASASKLIRLYLALYRREGKTLDLLKAKALADSIVNVQEDDGRVATFWTTTTGRDGDWVNCMESAALALLNVSGFQAVCDASERARDAETSVIRPDFRITVGGREVKSAWDGVKLDFVKMLGEDRSREKPGEEYEATGEAVLVVPKTEEYVFDLDADWRLWVTVNGEEVFAMPDGWRSKVAHQVGVTLKEGANRIRFRFGAGTFGAWVKFRVAPPTVRMDAEPDAKALVPLPSTF